MIRGLLARLLRRRPRSRTGILPMDHRAARERAQMRAHREACAGRDQQDHHL